MPRPILFLFEDLSELPQHPPFQTGRSLASERDEIIANQVRMDSTKVGFTLGCRAYLSSARLEFCGSGKELR